MDAQQLLYLLMACLLGLANSLTLRAGVLTRWGALGAAFAVPCALAHCRPAWWGATQERGQARMYVCLHAALAASPEKALVCRQGQPRLKSHLRICSQWAADHYLFVTGRTPFWRRYQQHREAVLRSSLGACVAATAAWAQHGGLGAGPAAWLRYLLWQGALLLAAPLTAPVRRPACRHTPPASFQGAPTMPNLLLRSRL